MDFDPTAQWDERRVMEIFSRDLLPVLAKRGPEIGEKAMQGDVLAEDVIRRYHVFACWLDPVNLGLLTGCLRRWEASDARD